VMENTGFGGLLGGVAPLPGPPLSLPLALVLAPALARPVARASRGEEAGVGGVDCGPPPMRLCNTVFDGVRVDTAPLRAAGTGSRERGWSRGTCWGRCSV